MAIWSSGTKDNIWRRWAFDQITDLIADLAALTIVVDTKVDTSGTPVADQVAIFTDADTIEGDADLTFDGDALKLGGQGYVETQTLSDAATVNWNMNNGSVAKVTLGGNRTMAAPTNLKDGGTYILRVIQDGTGSRTVTWNSVFKWPGGTAPTLTTTASGIDIASFVSDGTNLYGITLLAFS